MSRVEKRESPRAIVHKRILDIAEAEPEASVEAIADEIAGATPDLVKRVLEEYGDPAGTSPASGEQEPVMSKNGQTAESTDDESLDLTERQRETLRLVHENPDAAQADIAEALGVSRATVSRRLGDVPGFEWDDRAAFTAGLFDDDPGSGPDLGDEVPEDPQETDAAGSEDTGSEQADPSGSGNERADGPADARADRDTQAEEDARDALARFDDRLAALEDRVEPDDGRSVTLEPDLAHRVVHACMASDRISEDEELRLLRSLLE